MVLIEVIIVPQMGNHFSVADLSPSDLDSVHGAPSDDLLLIVL
jgi:hypothetical protein